MEIDNKENEKVLLLLIVLFNYQRTCKAITSKNEVLHAIYLCNFLRLFSFLFNDKFGSFVRADIGI
jgi:hypothetical protein